MEEEKKDTPTIEEITAEMREALKYSLPFAEVVQCKEKPRTYCKTLGKKYVPQIVCITDHIICPSHMMDIAFRYANKREVREDAIDVWLMRHLSRDKYNKVKELRKRFKELSFSNSATEKEIFIAITGKHALIREESGKYQPRRKTALLTLDALAKGKKENECLRVLGTITDKYMDYIIFDQKLFEGVFVIARNYRYRYNRGKTNNKDLYEEAQKIMEIVGL